MLRPKHILVNSLMLSIIVFLAASPAFARSTSQAVGFVETNFINARPASNTQGVNKIQGYSRWWFMPPCTYGQRGNIIFTVKTGPVTVDFVSSKTTYHDDEVCTADTCGYTAWAPAYGLLEQGEAMWFVTVDGNSPIITSGWCSAIASPGK